MDKRIKQTVSRKLQSNGSKSSSSLLDTPESEVLGSSQFAHRGFTKPICFIFVFAWKCFLDSSFRCINLFSNPGFDELIVRTQISCFLVPNELFAHFALVSPPVHKSFLYQLKGLETEQILPILSS